MLTTLSDITRAPAWLLFAEDVDVEGKGSGCSWDLVPASSCLTVWPWLSLWSSVSPNVQLEGPRSVEVDRRLVRK